MEINQNRGEENKGSVGCGSEKIGKGMEKRWKREEIKKENNGMNEWTVEISNTKRRN